MLMIILLQSMVMIELVAVKYWDTKNGLTQFFKTTTPLTALTRVDSRGKTSKIINTPLTKEQKKFLKKVTLGLKEKVIKLSSFLGENLLLKNSTMAFNKRKDLESQAKKFLGIRYVWGATGPNKFDCSGFTQKVYKMSGIKLPRHSTRQAMVGEYIKYKDLQRGDMVFFDTSKKHKGVVNHVGIYLEDGKFIHASSGKKKVVITSFEKKKFYKNRFLWGRRLIKEKKVKIPSLNSKVIQLLTLTTFKKYNKVPS